jgi:hypothetical protein
MTYKWCGNFSGEVFFGSTFSCGHIAIDLPGELSVIRRAPNQCPAKGFKAASGAVRSLPAAIKD